MFDFLTQIQHYDLMMWVFMLTVFNSAIIFYWVTNKLWKKIYEIIYEGFFE